MSDARPTTNRIRRTRWVRAALVVLAMSPFVATLAHGFIYDDTTVIRFNPRIHGWSSLLWLWTQPYWGPGHANLTGLYRPLYMALMAAFWNGTNHAPIWFHLLVVALHSLATLVVFRLFARGVSATAAAIGAAWFAVHPIHVEAVASIANASEIVVLLFTGALALLLTRRVTDEGEASWGDAALAGLIYLGACATKESGFVAPALAASFALGWCTGTSSAPRAADAMRRWRRIIMACGVALVVIIAARIAVLGAFAPAGMAAPGLDDLSFVQRTWAMLSLGPLIARLLLWPNQLNPHYGPSYVDGKTGPTLAAALTLAAIVLAVVLSVRRARTGDRRPLAALAWTLIAFFPASNLLTPTGQIFAERTLYGASVGAGMLVALAAQAALSRVSATTGARYWANRAVVGAAALVVIATLSARTWIGVRAWRSHPALFREMVAADSASYRGRWLLGLDARSRGDTTAALAWLGQAYALYPRDRQLVIDYSETLMQHGQPREAAAVARRLMDWPELRRRPEAVALYLNSVERGYGPDSAIAAGRWLRASVDGPVAQKARLMP